jgi:CDP-diacylglycerol--serine O-phosphatidyltransferase
VRLFDPVPPRTIPPNLITATALGCGLSSIYASLALHDFTLAAWLVLLSVLLDKLDGSVARALKGATEFGVQFDSFADATAFGAAPAALVVGLCETLVPTVWGPQALVLGLPAGVVLKGLALFYAIMTVVRLARFNVMTSTIGPLLFLGLPSTVSGAMICSGFLGWQELGWHTLHPGWLAWLPVAMLLNALAMVSNLPLPKLKASKNKAIKAIQLTIGAYIYLSVLLRTGLWVTHAVMAGYLLIGFVFSGPKLWREALAAPKDLP